VSGRDRAAPVAGVAALFAALYFVQAVGDPSSGLLSQPIRGLLRDWGLGAAAIAGFMALLAVPWAAKPVLGLLSDFVPLFGSRRRSYMVIATGGACVGLLLLYALPVEPGRRWVLLALLLVPAIGIALSDVVADALMVEIGQPRGLTGRLQSVQWAAAYAGLLLSGAAGGWLTELGRQDLAFLACAILWGASFTIAVVALKEPVGARFHDSRRAAAGALREALRAPGLLTIALLQFVWNFNPLWASVLYLHLTGSVGFSEQTYGNTYSWFSAGALAASVLYGLYCRRVPLGGLAHLSIVAGIGANLAYWTIADAGTAYRISVFAGLAYMTGTLIQLDLAARLIPLRAAATLFALIMALSNLASALGELAGGYLYAASTSSVGATGAYKTVVAISALVSAACWLLLPRLKRERPEWWSASTSKRAPTAE
jgi:MFS family permease